MNEAEKSGTEKPELVIDEDWKTKVQAEKKAAAEQDEGSPQDASSGPSPQDAPQTAETGPLPGASFTEVVSMLAIQAAGALGQIPDPEQGHPVVRPDLAKHFIDLLGILETKTQGNLTAEEEKMLDAILSELRLAFVSVQSHPPKSK